MRAFRLEPGADRCLDDIYDYTLRRWGVEQADKYTTELFDEIAAIADRRLSWRPIAAEFGVDGFCRRWRRHVIYWKVQDREIAIVALLHERMHQAARLQSLVEG